MASTRAARAGLRAMLAGAEVEVVGEASGLEDCDEALAGVDALVVDEEALPEARRALATTSDAPALVVLAGDLGLVAVLRSLPIRGWALVPPEAEAAELQAAVVAASEGLAVLSPDLLGRLLGAPRPTALDLEPIEEPLTAREREVLELVSQGLSNKLIAQRLRLSEHTVKYHVSSIYSKLGAASRTEAVSIGVRRGLISI